MRPPAALRHHLRARRCQLGASRAGHVGLCRCCRCLMRHHRSALWCIGGRSCSHARSLSRADRSPAARRDPRSVPSIRLLSCGSPHHRCASNLVICTIIDWIYSSSGSLDLFQSILCPKPSWKRQGRRWGPEWQRTQPRRDTHTELYTGSRARGRARTEPANGQRSGAGRCRHARRGACGPGPGSGGGGGGGGGRREDERTGAVADRDEHSLPGRRRRGPRGDGRGQDHGEERLRPHVC